MSADKYHHFLNNAKYIAVKDRGTHIYILKNIKT